MAAKKVLEFADNRFKVVGLDEVEVSGTNARAVKPSDPDIAEMARTIEKHDVLAPLVVRPRAEGGYTLIAGERRLIAARKSGRASIPVIIRDVSDDEAAELSAIENLHRRDLAPLEQAAAIARLLTDGKTLQDAAKSLGKTVAWVAKRAKLRDLCAEWRQDHETPALGVSKWTASHLELVARLPVDVQRAYRDTLNKKHKDSDEALLALWTVDELAASIARFTRDLSKAPWKLDAPGKPLPCSDCSQTTKEQPELWDEEGFRCLDKKCYEKKLNRYLKQRVKILRGEHGQKLMLISADAFRSTERVASIHDVERCKKSGKGARYAIVVKGEGAGAEYWAKYKEGCGPSGPPYKYAGELAELVNAQIEQLDEAAFGKTFADRAWLAWFIAAHKTVPAKSELRLSQKAKDGQAIAQCAQGFLVKKKHFANGVEPEERLQLELLGIDVDALKAQIDKQHEEKA